MDQQYLHPGTANFNPLQNFKGFASSRPPLLVFLICLLAFAATAASLAFIVHKSELKDSTITVDWNEILSKLTALDVCVHNDALSWKTPSLASNEEKVAYEQTEDFLLGLPTDIPSAGHNNYSVSFRVNLKFGNEIHALAANVTSFTGYACRRSLGFNDESVTESVAVTFDLPSDRKIGKCKTRKCLYDIPVCVTFHGLPRLSFSRKMPTCSASINASTFHLATFSGLECNADYTTRGTRSKTPSSCEGYNLPIYYRSNPEWSLFLSQHERALINLHLMYTSYFLLVMAMTLVCYAIIRGRPKQKFLVTERLLLET